MRTLLPLLWLFGCPPGTDTDTGPDDTADTDTADSGDSDDPFPGDADDDGSLDEDDCDDADPDVHPGADEICDGKDSDCAGGMPHGETDGDGDGLLDCMHCEAAGFWRATRDVDGASALRAALDGAATPIVCSYNQSTNYMFLRLDNVDFQVECVYTGRKTTVTTEKPDPNTDMNTEHTWPQSEGADVEPAKCDLHHLYPTDVDANSARGNTPFGEVVSGVSWSEGGSMLGKNASGATVFEPRDVHKGNVARSMLYFAWRYDKTLSSSQIALFKAWHDADPIDGREWDRTAEIAVQDGEENPFVACPDLVDRAW